MQGRWKRSKGGRLRQSPLKPTKVTLFYPKKGEEMWKTKATAQ